MSPTVAEKDAIAARLCVFAWDMDGLTALDEVERQRVNDLAGWVMRDRAAVRAEERARCVALANEKVGPSSAVTLHDYEAGFHRKDCRWCALTGGPHE